MLIGFVFIVFVVLIILGLIFSSVFLIWWVKNGIMLKIKGIKVVLVLIVVLIKKWVVKVKRESKIMKGMEWMILINLLSILNSSLLVSNLFGCVIINVIFKMILMILLMNVV